MRDLTANNSPKHFSSALARTIAGLCLLALFVAAGAASAQPVGFLCTGEAFVVQKNDAQLFNVDQSVIPFVFVPEGASVGFRYNSMGFRRTDGFLYAIEGNKVLATSNLLRIGQDGEFTDLGAVVGLPSTAPNAGDVSVGPASVDGKTLYVNRNGVGTLYAVDLTTGAPYTAVPMAISGGGGAVFDWAYSPIDNLLYGADNFGQVARLDPSTGTRVDLNVSGLGLPAANYGGSWFNAAGQLFVYKNDGFIYQIDVSDPLDPTRVVPALVGENSQGQNDAAACIQDLVGTAKEMTPTTVTGGLPQTITIVYTFENVSVAPNARDLVDLWANDSLSAIFGAHGTDWVFVSISGTYANLSFDGHTDMDLFHSPGPTLASGETTTVTVELDLLTSSGLDENGQFCNQITAMALDNAGGAFGDLSTNGVLPDPNDDGSPDERDPSCIDVEPFAGSSATKTHALTNDVAPPGVSLGDTITYTYTLTNTGDVTISNAVIADTSLPGLGPVTCDQVQPATLLPGDTLICTATYEVTQTDVDAGNIHNEALVTGECPTDQGASTCVDECVDNTPGDAICNPDDDVPVPQNPAIDIQKTPDFQEVSSGDTALFDIVVTNIGNVTLTSVSVDDPLAPDCDRANLGTLAPGGSATYSCSLTNVTVGFINVATATGQCTTAGCPVVDDDDAVVELIACDLLLDKTCQVIVPPADFVCSDTKPIDCLTMIWNGTDPVGSFTAWDGAVGGTELFDVTISGGDSTVDPGDEVTVCGMGGSPNDQQWEIDGQVSQFHISCSDDAMNGPEDCGNAAGDGKGNDAGLVNDWKFDGMEGTNGVALDCTPAPLDPTDNCEFLAPATPSCDQGNPDFLTWKYTGGGCGETNNQQEPGKHVCTETGGVIDGNLPIDIVDDDGNSTALNPGDEVTFTRSASKEITLTQGGVEEFNLIHVSCSQPLVAGDVFGSLTLVALDGRRAGLDVIYNYTVTNNGPDATNIVVTDIPLGEIGTIESLTTGNSATLSKTARIDSTTTNVAFAESQQECSAGPDTTTVTVTPCVGDLAFKEIDGKKVDWTLTNTGNTRLTIDTITVAWADGSDELKKIKFAGTEIFNISATPEPPLSSPVTIGDVKPFNKGDVGDRQIDSAESEDLRFEFEADVNTDPAGYFVDVTFEEGCTVSFPTSPAIDIRKQEEGPDLRPFDPFGSPISWDIVVKNVGDVPLTNVVVTDELVAACDNVVIGNLAVNQEEGFTCFSDPPTGPFTNIACVTGEGGGETVGDCDPSSLDPLR